MVTVRTVAATSLVVAAGFNPLIEAHEVRSLGFGLAFGWLPIATVIDAVRRHQPRVWLRLAGGAVDVGALAVTISVYEALGDLTLLALAIVVAGYLLVGDPGSGWAVAAAATGVSVGATVVPADPAVTRSGAVAFVGLVAALAVLGGRAAGERTRSSVGLARIYGRSDAILRGIGDAVAITSLRGRIRQWNEAAEITFSCPRGDALHRDCTDVLGLHRDVAVLNCSSGCPLLGAGDQEVWRLHPNGERQPLLVTASAVYNDEGAVTEVVHSLRDVTMLKQADEAKTMFLATASHELKTPLSVIRGFTEMLLEESGLDGNHRVALDAIHRRTRDLSRIVDRLLMSSRIEAGHLSLDVTAIDVVPLVHELAESVGNARQHPIEVSVAPDVPPAVADGDAVHTVVDHLVDNAIKYSPDGAIAVSVTVVDDHVVIAVADEGVGMTAAQAARCFDRFWQAEATDARRFGGTGIGLYIVRALVEGMGGSVGVDSELGRGSCFEVSLWVSGRQPASTPAALDEPHIVEHEPSIIKEFMRQVGVRPGGPT
ncbi:MAG TPA: PAS domain-containing sensor histidine kinase [Acidimicrobiales bacterium]